jgi:hypothetical protein
MYETGTMRTVETIPRRGGKESNGEMNLIET